MGTLFTTLQYSLKALCPFYLQGFHDQRSLHEHGSHFGRISIILVESCRWLQRSHSCPCLDHCNWYLIQRVCTVWFLPALSPLLLASCRNIWWLDSWLLYLKCTVEYSWSWNYKNLCSFSLISSEILVLFLEALYNGSFNTVLYFSCDIKIMMIKNGRLNKIKNKILIICWDDVIIIFNCIKNDKEWILMSNPSRRNFILVDTFQLS